MIIEIKNRFSDAIIWRGEAASSKEAVKRPPKRERTFRERTFRASCGPVPGANLHRADLSGATLHRANLGSDPFGSEPFGSDPFGSASGAEVAPRFARKAMCWQC